MLKIFILLVISMILIYILVSSEFAFKKAFLAKRKDENYEIERLKSWGLWSDDYYKNLEEVSIKSKEGFKLKGHLLEKYAGSNKYVILVHGYSAHYSLHMPFVPLFLKEGYNILLVEERAHGDSEGKYATYGFNESKDLDLWIDFLEKRANKDLFIGLHGQSMGAATCMLCGARNKKVKFVIEDCGYSSAKEQMKYYFSLNKFVSYHMVYWFFNLITKIICGFKFEDASPIEAIKNSDVPIFFIHGTKDVKVPCYMVEDLYKSRNNDKDELLIVDDSVHLTCYRDEKELYEAKLHEFLGRI